MAIQHTRLIDDDPWRASNGISGVMNGGSAAGDVEFKRWLRDWKVKQEEEIEARCEARPTTEKTNTETQQIKSATRWAMNGARTLNPFK